jgi:hypothetical protein
MDPFSNTDRKILVKFYLYLETSVPNNMRDLSNRNWFSLINSALYVLQVFVPSILTSNVNTVETRGFSTQRYER